MPEVDARLKILFSTSGGILVLLNSRSLSFYPYHSFSLMASNKTKGESEVPASPHPIPFHTTLQPPIPWDIREPLHHRLFVCDLISTFSEPGKEHSVRIKAARKCHSWVTEIYYFAVTRALCSSTEIPVPCGYNQSSSLSGKIMARNSTKE